MNRAFLQKVLHRILTLFISLAGSFTLVFLIRDTLPAGFVKPLGITLIFIAVIDIISILAHDLFVSEKANTFSYIRYAAYLNILLILLIKFCKPIISTGLLWIGTNLAIVLTYLIKHMFDLYEIFTEHTSNLAGKELSSDLTENSWFVSDYINYAKKIIWSLFIIALVLCAYILTLHIVKGYNTPGQYIGLSCFIAGFIALIIVHKVNDHETAFAFLGHNEIFQFRKHIMILCILLCLISAAGGTILSSDTAILKPSYFSWLFKMFSFDGVPTEYANYSTTEEGIAQTFELDENFYAENEQSLFSEIMHYVFIALEYIFVAALICGIVIFLISAFFGKKWREFWRNKKLSAFLRNAWVRLKKLIYDLLHMTRQKVAYNTVEAARFRDSIHDLLSGARKSKEKRAELDALTKKFMQLVDYAAAQGVSFKPHMAPLEFARLLADALSSNPSDTTTDTSKAGSTLTAGRLFEQALYAKELLTKEERTLFEESIEAVVK